MSVFLRGLGCISTLFVLASCELPQREIEIGPAPWTANSFTAPDGSEFPYSTWRPHAKPRAVVIAIHGLGGAASDWNPLGEHLEKQGFAVYAHELRAMGNDPVRSRVGRLDRRRGWQEDFTSFALRVQATHPDVPIYWYGESLGGIIGTHLLSRKRGAATPLQPAGFILASPIVQIQGKLPPWKEWALRLSACLLPGKQISLLNLAPENDPPAQVVSGTTHEQQLEKTPHAVTAFSLRTLDEIRRLVAHNHAMAPNISVPVMVLYGGKDLFTAPEEVEHFFAQLVRSDPKQKRYYPDGYHLLLHDEGREAVLDDVTTWLQRRLEIHSGRRVNDN